ncbi:hypothetical protein D3C76_1400590 [compost metagenome]
MGEPANQLVELLHIDLVAGEPELHLDLESAQLFEHHWRLVVADVHGHLDQVLQPIAQRGDPAFPASAIAASGNGILDIRWRR